MNLGYYLYSTGLPVVFQNTRSAESSNLMLVTIIVPVFAIILDAILLDQFVTGYDLFNFALVAIGLFIMDGRFSSGRFKQLTGLMRRVVFGTLFNIQFCKRMNRHNFYAL